MNKVQRPPRPRPARRPPLRTHAPGCPSDEDLVKPMPTELEFQAPSLSNRLRAARRRLALRIAEDQTLLHLTLRQNEGRWIPFGPGLSLKLLDRGAEGARYLLRMAPGATLPAHRHPRDEYCLVIEGRVRLGPLELGPGDWHQVRAGRSHGETAAPQGALLYLDGAMPSMDQRI